MVEARAFLDNAQTLRKSGNDLTQLSLERNYAVEKNKYRQVKDQVLCEATRYARKVAHVFESRETVTK